MNIRRTREAVFNKLGIDGAILYTTSARIIQAGGGIVTAFLLARFLSKDSILLLLLYWLFKYFLS